jgi:hypothetical protein
MTKRHLACWIAAVSAILITFVVFNGWYIYATLWHWRHGDWVQCGNRSVPVPHEWFRARYINECNVTVMSPEYLHSKGFAVSRFYPRTDAPSADDQQWRKDYAAMMMRNGYRVGRISELTAAGIPTVCVESTNPSDSKDLHITCAISKQMMIMFSYTDRKWETDFYNIVRGMK